MNFYKKFLSLFKAKTLEIYSPCDGEIIQQKDIPDEGFSEGHMGIGIGIKPTKTEVVAPFSGKLVVLFRTKHAYVIQDEASGISVLLHLGINTVNIDPELKAFETKLKQDDLVFAKDHLCTMNLGVINEKATSTISALLVQNENMENKKIVFINDSGMVKKGDLLFKIVNK